jgi:hypothetical protein
MPTLRIGRAALAAALAFVLLGVPGHAQAAPITFIFQSTIDATKLGGAASTPFIVEYSFDSSLSGGSGPSGGPGGTSYGPISGTLTVGSESVSFGGSGAGIFVRNNVGAVDEYDVRASGFGSFTGTLFGFSLDFFNFTIFDSDLNMLANESLPTNPAFALLGDFAQLRAESDCPDHCLFNQVNSAGFSLTDVSPVPLPGTLPLFISGLGVTGWLVWRNKRKPAASL